MRYSLYIPRLRLYLRHLYSGVKHLEEIRETNLELPDVNQIEVQWIRSVYYYATNPQSFLEAATLEPTEGNRGLLQEKRDRNRSVCTPHAHSVGRPGHLGDSEEGVSRQLTALPCNR